MSSPWCWLFHTKRVRSIAGTGAYRCRDCGTPFKDASDAGILLLDQFERQLSLDRVIRLEDIEEPTPEFVPRSFKILKGGKLVKEVKVA